MAKNLPSGNRTDRRRSLGNSPVKSVTAPLGTEPVTEVVVTAMAPSNPKAVQAPPDARSRERVSDKARNSVGSSVGGSAQEEPQAPQVGEVLVDVDTGPGGLGMVFWFTGG